MWPCRTRKMSNVSFAVLVLCLGTVGAARAEVVGAPLIARNGLDTGLNYLFLYDNGTATPGFTTPGVVTNWSFYNNNGTAEAGRTLEPVILKKDGVNWIVTGVGATLTTPASMNGIESFTFNLVAGSAIVGPGHTFAHHDLNNGGAIEYTAGAGVHRYLGRSGSKEQPGNTLTGFSTPGRTYSIQLNSTQAFETIGNSLIDGTSAGDGANGGIFMQTTGFSQKGRVVEWAFFDDDAFDPDREVTPLLLEQAGNNYFIRGIGATRTTDESGEQHFPFDLVDGTDLVEPGFFLAWKDGSLSADNMGVLDWSNSGSSTDGIRYFGASHLGPGVHEGRDLGAGTFYGRYYSVQATVLIPEPSTLILVGLGGIGLLLGYARRRRRR